jgi:hypothetical protein
MLYYVCMYVCNKEKKIEKETCCSYNMLRGNGAEASLFFFFYAFPRILRHSEHRHMFFCYERK